MTAVDTSILDNLEFDEEGFLANPADWTPEIGAAIAVEIGLDLTDRHWTVVNFAREVYEAEGEAPTLRRITKQSGVDTKEMYELFPGGPAKLAAQVAGLHKPTGCI